MHNMIDTAMGNGEVAAFVLRLKMQGYKVERFEAGYSCEVDGTQLFRATMMGNERFMVRYNEKVFPDV